MILAPGECQESRPAAAFLERIVAYDRNPVP